MPELHTEVSDTSLSMVQRKSLTSLVADAIEKHIITGKLAPGSKLNEAAIASDLGVSRGPLREALGMLKELGLISQEQNRSAFVRKISIEEAANIYDVRAGLDATVGRLLATRITPDQIETLRELTEQMQVAAVNNDVDNFHLLNLDFHEKLVEMTGNTTLIDVYRRLVKQLALFRRRNLLSPFAIQQFANEHSAIVDLLVIGNGSDCANALFDHAQGGRKHMIDEGDL